MNHSPIPLINTGLTCYLNSGLQALSSCSRFLNDIAELSTKYKDLTKLNVFYSLLRTIIGGDKPVNISNNYIFIEWNKPGQKDSFELLAHIINQVFDEIRRHKEIERGNLKAWLAMKLPMRMTLDYSITCRCGSKEKSPLQSDIALHLPFPPKDPNVSPDNYPSFRHYFRESESFRLQDLLDRFFEEENIWDFQCAVSSCRERNAFRKLKLYSPLPNTICIHLQRLFWNGSTLKKIDDTVSFCHRITIKGQYVTTNDSATEAPDQHYYLRSVIVHSGWETCSHYTCYKKCNNSWYYTSNTCIREERIDRVFSCNPYILFYEMSDIAEIAPQVIEEDDHVNSLVHALSSCSLFVTWLNDVSVVVIEDILLQTLHNLIDFANGNINRDKAVVKHLAKCLKWENKSPENVLMHINSVIFHSNMEGVVTKNKEYGVANIKFPMLIKVCHISQSTDRNMPENRTGSEVVLKLSYIQWPHGMVTVQNLLDLNFERKSSTMLLMHPLPNTVVIGFDTDCKWPRNEHLTLDYMIAIQEMNMHGSDYYTSLNHKIYYLKSIYNKSYCLRYINGLWYSVNRSMIKKIDAMYVKANFQSVLFYDTLTYEPSANVHNPPSVNPVSDDINHPVNVHNPPSVNPVSDDINPPSNDLNTPDDINHPVNVHNPLRINPPDDIHQSTLVNSIQIHGHSDDKMISQPYRNKHLHNLIYAIGSCSHFIRKLNQITPKSSNELSHFRYLLDLSTQSVGNNAVMDDYVSRKWYDNASDVDDLMILILDNVFNKTEGESSEEKGDLTRCIIVKQVGCCCAYTKLVDFQWFINLPVEDGVLDLQTLLLTYFKIANSSNYKCSTNECPKKRCNETNKLAIQLSETIFIRVPVLLRHKLTFTNEIVIDQKWYLQRKSGSLNNTEMYCLQSVITNDGLCYYKQRNNTWFQVTEHSPITVTTNTVFTSQPVLLFYEIKDTVVSDKHLRYIIHCLSSCATFITWLHAISDRSLQVKHILEQMKVVDQIVTNESFNSNWDISWSLASVFNDLANDLGINKRSDTDLQRLPMSVVKPHCTACNCHTNTFTSAEFILRLDPTRASTIQQLVSDYFNKCCCDHSASSSHSCRRNDTMDPLPTILCVQFDLFYEENGETQNYKCDINITEQIEITVKQRRIRFKLRSIIERFGERCSDKYMCYKLKDNKWVCVSDNRTISASLDEVRPYVMFYEVDNTPGSYVEREMFRNIPQVVVNFVQCISVCSKFIRVIRHAIGGSSKWSSLFAIIDIINGDTDASLTLSDHDLLRSFCSEHSDIGPFLHILPNLTSSAIDARPNESNEINQSIAIFNVVDIVSMSQSSSPVFIDIVASWEVRSQRNLQVIIDKCLVMYSNPLSPMKELHYQKDSKAYPVLFERGVPDTIGFSFLLTDRVHVHKEIKLTNKLCAQSAKKLECLDYEKCCLKYRLISMIDWMSLCYKLCNNRWYAIIDGAYSTVSELDIMNVQACIMFYERIG